MTLQWGREPAMIRVCKHRSTAIWCSHEVKTYKGFLQLYNPFSHSFRRMWVWFRQLWLYEQCRSWLSMDSRKRHKKWGGSHLWNWKWWVENRAIAVKITWKFKCGWKVSHNLNLYVWAVVPNLGIWAPQNQGRGQNVTLRGCKMITKTGNRRNDLEYEVVAKTYS